MLSQKKLICPVEPASKLRETVDPLGTLPHVVLAWDRTHEPNANPSYDYAPTYGFIILRKQGVVGKLALAERPGTDEYHLSGINVSPVGHRFGLAAYLLAIETAAEDQKAFATDRTLTPDSLRMWQKFLRLGIAEQVYPFEGMKPSLPFDQQKHYMGEARIETAEWCVPAYESQKERVADAASL